VRVAEHGRRTRIDVAGRRLQVHPGGAVTVEPLVLGARVEAEGPVYGDCDGGPTKPVHGDAACLPDASELLQQAVGARNTGASPRDLLAVIDAVLPTTAPSPARVELLALRVSLLVDAGEVDEALRGIDAYLALGVDVRRSDMEALARHLRGGPAAL